MTALVTVATYQWVTGDTATPSANVEQALAEAQQFVSEHCKRTFPDGSSGFVYGTYTETLDVWQNGCVYPTATPVGAVTSPASATLRLGGIYVGPIDPVFDALSPLPPQTTVTYAGGYHEYGAGVAPELPVKLAKAFARIAYLILHPNSIIGAGVPAGAKSASVGDVSVTGDLSGFVITDPSIERDLHRFERRHVAQLSGRR